MSVLQEVLATVPVDGEDWKLNAKARGMLRAYHHVYQQLQRKFNLQQVEPIYTSPLYNPESKRSSRTFQLAGRIDKVMRDADRTLIVDHKTTTADISPEAPYWQQLAVDSQPTHYTYLLHLNGVKCESVLWDVVRKPGIAPRKLTATAQRHYGMERENHELYENRVVETMLELPEKYFARRVCTRSNAELAEYTQEMWDIGKDILEARKGSRWYKNAGACMNYGVPCRFLGLCGGTEREDAWGVREQVHPELDPVEEPQALLTNSRIKTFQTCRRLHYYRYEKGYYKEDEQEREVLQFGRLWHELLDLWWAKMEDCDDGDEGSGETYLESATTQLWERGR